MFTWSVPQKQSLSPPVISTVQKYEALKTEAADDYHFCKRVNPNQIFNWCDNPLPSKQNHF